MRLSAGALRWRQPAARLSRAAPRPYSTAPAGGDDAPPPLLQRLKADLKTAMRAKDAPRLAVLRAVTSATLNASKTAAPVRTDAQLVALMRRLQQGIRDAAADAAAAGRQDLVDKEAEQERVLAAYLAASGVHAPSEAELEALVREAVEASEAAGTAARALVGDVMKRLAAPLEGKDVDRKQLAGLVRRLAGQ